MKLIVGLGNFGEKYEKTRHNLGFMVLDKFFKDFEKVDKSIWKDNKKFKSDIAKLEWSFGDTQDKHGKRLEKVILAKPKTYVNNSGLAVSLISEYLNIPVSDIWIIHDDIDLPLGGMRIRFGGSAGGHKGIKSIIKSLGTEKFWRFRLGIGSSKKMIDGKWQMKDRDIEDFVLKEFTHGEKGKVGELIKKSPLAIEMGLEEGLDKAMNKFNTR